MNKFKKVTEIIDSAKCLDIDFEGTLSTISDSFIIYNVTALLMK